MGVVSPSGKLLIDTMYQWITLFRDGGRKQLPPNERISNEVVEFYSVRNEEGQWAIFDPNGSKLFGFVDCEQLEIDERTQTIVKVVRQEDYQRFSYLYNFDGELMFPTPFEWVGYIRNSDLIALIAQDGSNEEYYLYNVATKAKLGPYSHFNIFNEQRSPLLGMEEEEFEQYKQLNIITVRQDTLNDYIWGVIDMRGNEVYPLAYKYFRVIEPDMRKRFIEPAEKPNEVEFLFYSARFGETGQVILFDKNMDRYLLDSVMKKIVKLE